MFQFFSLVRQLLPADFTNIRYLAAHDRAPIGLKYSYYLNWEPKSFQLVRLLENEVSIVADYSLCSTIDVPI